MEYITLLDFYRYPPKTLLECKAARRFLEKIGTPEAWSLLETVTMLERGFEAEKKHKE
jgi:hypothetical protein